MKLNACKLVKNHFIRFTGHVKKSYCFKSLRKFLQKLFSSVSELIIDLSLTIIKTGSTANVSCDFSNNRHSIVRGRGGGGGGGGGVGRDFILPLFGRTTKYF